jgi:hypothetical protein
MRNTEVPFAYLYAIVRGTGCLAQTLGVFLAGKHTKSLRMYKFIIGLPVAMSNRRR